MCIIPVCTVLGILSLFIAHHFCFGPSHPQVTHLKPPKTAGKMDSQNSSLLMLSSDVWTLISHYFRRGEALRLVMIGSAPLSAKLKRSVRLLDLTWFRSEYADWNKCLRSLDDFNYVSSLSLSTETPSHLSLFPVAWQMTSSHLTHLSLTFCHSMTALFATPSVFDNWPLLESLVVVEPLIYVSDVLIGHISLAQLPKTLKTLRLKPINFVNASAIDLASIPPKLRVFDVDVRFLADGLEKSVNPLWSNGFIQWPAHLEHLSLCMTQILVHLPSLPKSLTHLELCKYTKPVPEDWTKFSWEALFPRLQYLGAQWMREKSNHNSILPTMTETSSEGAHLYPSSLTTLDTQDFLSFIPPRHYAGPMTTLKELEDEDRELAAGGRCSLVRQLRTIVGYTPYAHIRLFPRLESATFFESSKVKLEALPPRLAELILPRNFALDHTAFPKTLTKLHAFSLKTEGVRMFTFPAGLKSLHLKQITLEILQDLPPSITSLSIPLPSEDCCKTLTLPRYDGSLIRFPGLVTLKISNFADFSSADMIPDTVQDLELYFELLDAKSSAKPWWRTGMKAKTSMRKLVCLGCTPNDLLLHLPPKLFQLRIECLEDPITDTRLVEALPQGLQSFCLEGVRRPVASSSEGPEVILPTLSEDALSLLPKSLTELELLEYGDSKKALPSVSARCLPSHLSILTPQVCPEYWNRYGDEVLLLTQRCTPTSKVFHPNIIKSLSSLR